MNAVHGVTAITRLAQAAAAYRVNRLPAASRSNPSAKPARSAAASASPAAAQSTASAGAANVPLGLMLSVSEPSASNKLATADYQDLRNALLSGSVATAQQAYLRLQTDLLMMTSTASGTSSTVTPLNVAG
jgi:hypothetical protein